MWPQIYPTVPNYQFLTAALRSHLKKIENFGDSGDIHLKMGPSEIVKDIWNYGGPGDIALEIVKEIGGSGEIVEGRSGFGGPRVSP